MAKLAYGAVIVLDIGDAFTKPTIDDLILMLEEKSYQDVEITDAAYGDIIITLTGARP